MKTYKVTYVLVLDAQVEAEDAEDAQQQVSEGFSSGEEMLELGKWTVTAE